MPIERKSDVSWDDFPYRKDTDGTPLCRKCGKRLSGRRTAWCSQECQRAVLLMTDWTVIRASILRRDKETCQVCGKDGSEVDHIQEIADGGSFWKPDNLRVLCRSCHKNKTKQAAKERRIRRKRGLLF